MSHNNNYINSFEMNVNNSYDINDIRYSQLHLSSTDDDDRIRFN